MATDPIGKYQEALGELAKATHEAESIVAVVVAAGDALRKNWANVVVENSNVGFPAELTFGGVPSINASNWPSAQALAEALAAFHTALPIATNAWNAVPNKASLQPPPS